MIEDNWNELLCLSKQVMLNQIDPKSINEYPHTLIVYFTFLVSPGLTAAFTITMFYFRNPSLRRFFAIEIMDLIGKIKDYFRF